MPVISELIKTAKGGDRFVSDYEIQGLICFSGSQKEDVSLLCKMINHCEPEQFIIRLNLLLNTKKQLVQEELDSMTRNRYATSLHTAEAGQVEGSKIYAALLKITPYSPVCPCFPWSPRVDVYNKNIVNFYETILGVTGITMTFLAQEWGFVKQARTDFGGNATTAEKPWEDKTIDILMIVGIGVLFVGAVLFSIRKTTMTYQTNINANFFRVAKEVMNARSGLDTLAQGLRKKVKNNPKEARKEFDSVKAELSRKYGGDATVNSVEGFLFDVLPKGGTQTVYGNIAPGHGEFASFHVDGTVHHVTENELKMLETFSYGKFS